MKEQIQTRLGEGPAAPVGGPGSVPAPPWGPAALGEELDVCKGLGGRRPSCSPSRAGSSVQSDLVLGGRHPALADQAGAGRPGGAGKVAEVTSGPWRHTERCCRLLDPLSSLRKTFHLLLREKRSQGPWATMRSGEQEPKALLPLLPPPLVSCPLIPWEGPPCICAHPPCLLQGLGARTSGSRQPWLPVPAVPRLPLLHRPRLSCPPWNGLCLLLQQGPAEAFTGCQALFCALGIHGELNNVASSGTQNPQTEQRMCRLGRGVGVGGIKGRKAGGGCHAVRGGQTGPPGEIIQNGGVMTGGRKAFSINVGTRTANGRAWRERTGVVLPAGVAGAEGWDDATHLLPLNRRPCGEDERWTRAGAGG